MFRYHFLKVKNTPTEMIPPSYDCSRPQSNFGCRPKLTAVMSDIQQMGLGMVFFTNFNHRQTKASNVCRTVLNY